MAINQPSLISDSVQDSFDEFWASYPAKKGGKLRARSLWKRLGCYKKSDKIMRSISDQKKWREYQQSLDKWVPDWPHATTWLNQGRWDDNVEIVKKNEDVHSTKTVSSIKKVKDDYQAGVDRNNAELEGKNLEELKSFVVKETGMFSEANPEAHALLRSLMAKYLRDKVAIDA